MAVAVAFGVREFGTLTSNNACQTACLSCLSWLWSVTVVGIAKLTEAGRVVSSFLTSHCGSPKSTVRISPAPMPICLEPTIVPPTPKLVDIKPRHLRPAPVIDRSLVDRKLWLLSRSGLFGDNTLGATIERACTLEDLRKAYRLVHDVYLGTGFIEPVATGMRLRIFEMTADMATFVAKVDGKVVGVLGVVADTPELGLPSDASFKAELDALRATGQRLCEITNQAVDPAYRKSAVPTELMRCAVAHMTAAGFHQAIATVSPSHSSFYDLSGFRQFGAERSYSQKLHDPVVALSMDICQFRKAPVGLNGTEEFIHHFLGPGNHFSPHVEEWANEAQRYFLDPELLAELFISERIFIVDCSATELEGLKTLWGHDLFIKVTSDCFIPSAEKLVLAALPKLFGADADRVAEEPPKKKNPEPAEMNPREWEQASGSLTHSLDSWSNLARPLQVA